MKTITIQVPDDCEVKIVKKEEKPIIRTYQDLIDNEIEIKGYFKSGTSISCDTFLPCEENSSASASEKVAKSMIAMAMISQLMPYYGGEVTNEEWRNYKITKYIIGSYENKIVTKIYTDCYYYFLAFHTKEQRDEFLKYNEQLVKDYLML